MGLGIRVAAVLLSAYVAACGPSEPKVGTQTNWLRSCRSDADCGGFDCLCGACTRSCDEEAGCSGLPGASCVPAEDDGAVALCAGKPPANPGLCLPRCPADGCESGTSCVAGVCTPNLEPTAHVEVDESQRFQTLTGIGAAVAYVNDEVVRHPRKSALFDAMFSGTGLGVIRLRNGYGDDNPDLSSTQEIVDAAEQRLSYRPLIVLNSASPPDSLKANGDTWCEGNPDTCTLATLPDGSFDYAGLASYWRASLEAYAAVGIHPDYVSIQNNPNWVPAPGAAGEACRFLPSEGSATVNVNGEDVSVDYPGYAQALDAVLGEFDGLDPVPKIVAPETTNITGPPEYVDRLDMATVDAIGYHMYGTDAANLDMSALLALTQVAEENERPLFQSEVQTDALSTAVLMHAALVIQSAALFVQNGFVASASRIEPDSTALINLTDDDFVLGDPYYVMLQYSAHLAPEWVRVAADSDAENVLASAWVSPDDATMTIVLTNPGIGKQVVQIDVGMRAASESVVTRTALGGVERARDLGELPPDGRVTLPGHSLVTIDMLR